MKALPDILDNFRVRRFRPLPLPCSAREMDGEDLVGGHLLDGERMDTEGREKSICVGGPVHSSSVKDNLRSFFFLLLPPPPQDPYHISLRRQTGGCGRGQPPYPTRQGGEVFLERGKCKQAKSGQRGEVLRKKRWVGGQM